MKNIKLITVLVLCMIGFTQCKNQKEDYIPAQGAVSDNPHHKGVDVNKPFYYAVVTEKIDAGAYSYLKVRENIKDHQHSEAEKNDHMFWVAVEASPVKVGEDIRFQKEMVTKQFKSKTLNRTFDEIMFASNLQYKIK